MILSHQIGRDECELACEAREKCQATLKSLEICGHNDQLQWLCDFLQLHSAVYT